MFQIIRRLGLGVCWVGVLAAAVCGQTGDGRVLVRLPDGRVVQRDAQRVVSTGRVQGAPAGASSQNLTAREADLRRRLHEAAAAQQARNVVMFRDLEKERQAYERAMLKTFGTAHPRPIKRPTKEQVELDRLWRQQLVLGALHQSALNVAAATAPGTGVQARPAVPLFGLPQGRYPTDFAANSTSTSVPIPPAGYPVQAYPIPVPGIAGGSFQPPGFPQDLSAMNVGFGTITYTPYTPLTATYFSYPSQSVAVPLYNGPANVTVGLGPNTYVPVGSATSIYQAGYGSTIYSGQGTAGSPVGANGLPTFPSNAPTGP
jgi:hypothetical protein